MSLFALAEVKTDTVCSRYQFKLVSVLVHFVHPNTKHEVLALLPGKGFH